MSWTWNAMDGQRAGLGRGRAMDGRLAAKQWGGLDRAEGGGLTARRAAV